jgi:hypothetical protein
MKFRTDLFFEANFGVLDPRNTIMFKNYITAGKEDILKYRE